MESEKRNLIILILLYIIVFSTLCVLKHNSFNSTAFDLGLYDQSVWGYSQGKTIFNTVRGAFPFGDHVTPILFLLAPFYLVYSSPVTLVILQTILLALGAVPLYWFAREKLGKRFGVPFALLYLLYPSMQYINLFDFHPDALMIPLFLFAFYYLEKKEHAKGFLFIALAGMCKEYAPLLVSMMGLYMFFVKKNKKTGLSIFFIGLLWFFINIKIITPFYRPEGFAYFSMYGYLGNSLSEIIFTSMTNPLLVLSNLATPGKAIYLALLFMPLLPALLSLEFLIALPGFFIILLSQTTSYSAIVYQHTSMLIPFLFISAVYGVKKILRTKLLKPKLVLSLILAMGLISYFAYGPFTVLYRINDFNTNTAHVKAGYEALDLIPKDASLSASSWALPHLSHRSMIYMFPNPFHEIASLSKPLLNSTDYVLLDVSRKDPMLSQSNFDNYKNEIMNNKNYIVVFEKQGWLLLKRIT